MIWVGPPDSWYQPPEPRECCDLADDDPDHDREACWAEQAEAAAEDKADRMREEAMFARDDRDEW